MGRWWTVGLLAFVLSGCGLAEKLPEGPVMSPWDRLRGFSPPEGSGAAYTGEPQVSFPVIPVLNFGAAYDLDIVVVSRSPDWDMHEYALLDTPRGPVWLVKEARAGTLEQTLVADLPDIDQWFPELPMVRRHVAVEVDDRSDAKRVDVRLAYENIDGVPVSVHYRGKPPVDALSKRNGSTMGHSRDHVMAVLDLPYRGLGRADIEIGGKNVGVKRILGLVPFAMTLAQTQAGLAIGRFSQAEVEGGARTVHHKDNLDVPLDWRIERGDGRVDLVQESEIRTLQYRFLERDGALELASTTAFQWGKPAPTSHIALQPALPDLRRRFEGVHRSRFVVDVNGQPNHAVGTLEAWWEADGPRVRLLPEAPWWVADRPMLTTIRYADGAAEVEIARIPTARPSGTGAKADAAP